MRKKRILLLSEGFGTGHTQAAYALSVGIRQLAPEMQTRVMELGKFLNPTVAPLIFAAYRKTVSVSPKLVGMLYRKQYKKSLNRVTQSALHRIFYTQASHVIRQLRPDAIVCTHPFPSIVVSRLKRAGIDVPLYTLITDYDAHGTWITPEVNKYLVSAPEVEQKLIQRGISPGQIIVTGIPVHPKFWQRCPQAEAQQRLGLKPLPTVMLMGGGWGLALDEELLRYMTKYRDHIQLLLCMGSNEKAMQRIEQDPVFQHPNIRIFGYTQEVSMLMDASDLLITKPGGMTCTEGMMKGIPMLFHAPIPGQEEENCDFFIEHGFGELLESRETIDRWFHDLSQHYETLRQKRQLGPSPEMKPDGCPRAVIDLLWHPQY
ncbi:UDP-N-acetylglucosamine--LPS N-acetylglucosamine transferase [Paenibacillus thiaminolyticus]|uniref:UDP-N-acetylglucosamine--LPS N-acetylglucosamine transferase n=1 Tax=Paenibacillus thiaminolyticus TaxID=49283 RepID=A0AAP9DU40_PANTH|nr:glycosyltransferase [Paenibacillus thiaminolyticus]MCY9533779.1 UDP-N-acetylglucosamine--LPS N-acetylglucosamine transferase [Paenibacillus thiaminolyticus]MCY9600271.1 UDP-N-acetylglucosamine--LPS N-acetylglucosamine transferase [Paenibacillus thiaminolyticus]MCY9607830.1 UDP-N-acetylglucosamine--LPS N-acetylglucosamine transferase [Paenibacillus thiaminolyticus]MCY9611917.1 UDP-N-acetylglucosamine--LPS N-acetylglucosamine transferase [Paenibacillus thiaminolyticus]MCY9617863.1 UDP-N-acety